MGRSIDYLLDFLPIFERYENFVDSVFRCFVYRYVGYHVDCASLSESPLPTDQSNREDGGGGLE